MFSTYDNDNDKWGASCSVWIDNTRKKWRMVVLFSVLLLLAHQSQLPIQYGSILIPGGWKNARWIEMKIRPLNCIPQ